MQRVGMKGTAAIVLAWSASAAADDSGTKLGQYRLDLSVPDIPAFTTLGVSPSTISRPDNVKDLAAAFSSGLAGTGGIQSGVAIEVSPEKLGANEGLFTASKGITDVLGGLRLSLATNVVAPSAATNNQTRTFLAIAGRYGYSTYQPETDMLLQSCIGSALLAALNKAPKPKEPLPERPDKPTGSTVTTDKPPLVDVPLLAECRQMIRSAHLSTDFAFEVAYADSEVAVDSTEISDLHPYTDTLWASFTFNLYRSFSSGNIESALKCTSDTCSGWSNAIATLQRRWANAWAAAPIVFVRLDDARISPATSADREVDLYLAARLPVISNGWSVFAEGGHKFMDLTNKIPAKPKDSTPVGLGFDLRLGTGTWLGLYAGADAKSGAILSLGNIKWSIGESRPF